MTDTMREWYNKRFANRNPDLCEHGYEDMLEAWQAAQADARAEREKARALVGELSNDFVWVREYIRRYVIIHPASTTDGATPEQKICSVINNALTKAQAFMEGK